MQAHARGRTALVVGLVAAALAVGVAPHGAVSAAGGATSQGAAQVAASARTAPWSSNPPQAAVAPEDRPNIVLITSDDQSATDMRYMPRTRRLLGKAGITFSGALSPHPLCCPARAEILTGEYAQNNGVWHNDGSRGGYAQFDQVNGDDHLGTWLQQAGYNTAFAGKSLNGYHPGKFGRPGGWTHWNPLYGRGIYAYYNYTLWQDGAPTFFRNQHVADTLGAATEEYIEEFSREDKPFFIWASQPGPHTSPNGKGGWTDPVPAVRHRTAFANLPLPQARKRSFGAKDDIRDLPRFLRGQVATRFTTKRNIAASTANLRRLNQARARNLLSIDEANARTIAALDRTGELDDTIVIYTSDNGVMLGEHRLSGKNYPYEENLRVPLLMRGPGVPAGATNPAPITTVDLAPTMLDLAGVLRKVRAAGRTDGITMLPVLRAPGRANPTSLIQAGASSRNWNFRGVRTERYTWVLWFNGEIELYDRRVDPLQMRNLGGPDGRLRDARYRAVEAGLRARYQALRSCHGVKQCELRAFAPLPQPRLGAARSAQPHATPEATLPLPGSPATGWEWEGG